jgi:thiamine biosynthesis lipoprotein
VQTVVEDLDRACSRFRGDSELVRLERGRPVRISRLLRDALVAALNAARATGGLVDPTIGRSLRLAGYDTTFRLVARRDGKSFRADLCRIPGWESVELDAEARVVVIPGDVELDLGATAKAFAADRSASAAARVAGCGVLVSLGGDVAVAGAPVSGGWPIGVADDHKAVAVDETVAIAAGGLATSSTLVRRWRSCAGSLHHLIDPRTGRPAVTPWRTATAVGASCLDANVASTAAILLGDAAVEWLRARGIAARLVALDGRVTRVCGWPAEQTAA